MVVEEAKLIFTSVQNNNNKFWNASLYENGDVVAHWGRIGYSGETTTYSGGKKVFDKKIREKLNKGYTYASVVAQIGSSSVVNDKQTLHDIATKEIAKGNPELTKLVARLVQNNIHAIQSSTNIVYNSSTNLFSTPLGIVTPGGITDARHYLDLIADHLEVYGCDKADSFVENVNQYLRLIPTNYGMKLDVCRIFPNMDAVSKQLDILDSLEASYQAVTTSPVSTGKVAEQVFKVDLDLINNSREASRLVDWFENSKKSMHNYNHIHVVNVYAVDIHDVSNSFRENLKPIQEVWHGSGMSNTLSILKSGIKINPPSTARVAGKLYGSGAYGSTNSSKSLGYTFNRWGQGGVGDSGWLFVCKFALGKIYYPNTYSANLPRGYDSLWAMAKNTGLHNDEIVVYNNNQIKITHLLECK